MKLLFVMFGITAMQLEFAASTKFVKLHVIVGGTVSSTSTVRVAVLVLPLASTAMYVTRFVPMALMFTVPLVASSAMPEHASLAVTPGSVKGAPN